MGEAFKRMRAAPFVHRRRRHAQELADDDLLTLTRPTHTSFEVKTRLGTAADLPVGASCVIAQDAAGTRQVLYGNRVVAVLPPEAGEILDSLQRQAPALNGLFPCRVTGLSAFGAVTLLLGAGDQ